MSRPLYDFAIVGAGAAGLNLALKMAEDPFFKRKQILVLDSDPKTANDRTYSFWEKGESKWDQIVEKKWKEARFCSDRGNVSIPMGDYTYKTIRSSKFYQYAKDVIHKQSNFTWVLDKVEHIEDGEIQGQTSTYEAAHCFDSRVDSDFQKESSNYESLTQHFMGWFIETEEDAFDDSVVTMMDYRLKWKDHTSFTYVLPFSKRFALVEFTLFNNELLTKEEYEEKLRFYIYHYLKIEHFEIKEVEYGAIPMSTYPFTMHHTEHVSKIGTAGGWVRPSSGYSFKNSDRYSQMIIDNIKAGKTPHHAVATNRFRMYDKIFLRVLQDRNDLGEKIFHTLYAQKNTAALFRFLDEQSSLIEDANIMLSLNQPAFRKALLQTL